LRYFTGLKQLNDLYIENYEEIDDIHEILEPSKVLKLEIENARNL
jgi:hypothetical protein